MIELHRKSNQKPIINISSKVAKSTFLPRLKNNSERIFDHLCFTTMDICHLELTEEEVMLLMPLNNF